MSAGDRGKWAEQQVQKVMEAFSAKHLHFDWERLPDARAARGALKAQIADFAWFSHQLAGTNHHGVIEVKETTHEYRIAKDKIAQVPRLRKRALAGGHVLVMIYHSTLQKWRVMTLKDIGTEGPIPPSWDISHLPLYNDEMGILMPYLSRFV